MISDCSSNYWISIHAPTRGATWWGVVCTSTIYISIHAPTRGATALGVPTVPTFLFQSTLPREERRRGDR